MSMTSMHPESWNPAWTVQQILIGLVSFWYEDVYTSGGMYFGGQDAKEQKIIARVKSAMTSRKQTLEHPKFQEVFTDYVNYIGIQDDQYKAPEVWSKNGERRMKEARLKMIGIRAIENMKHTVRTFMRKLADAGKAKKDAQIQEDKRQRA